MHAIAADAGGSELAAPEATVLLMNEADTDAPAIASVVWWAFCRVGADEGVGATWCADAEEVTEEDDVEQAASVVGSPPGPRPLSASSSGSNLGASEEPPAVHGGGPGGPSCRTDR